MTVCETARQVSAEQLIHRKPSRVVRATIHGLKTAHEDPNFVLDMDTYGDTVNEDNKTMCVGCMATAAMQSLFNVKFNVREIEYRLKRFTALHTPSTSHSYLQRLEWAIDDLRQGSVRPLLNACELSDAEADLFPYVPLSNGSQQYCSVPLLEGEPSEDDIERAIVRLGHLADQLERAGF